MTTSLCSVRFKTMLTSSNFQCTLCHPSHTFHASLHMADCPKKCATPTNTNARVGSNTNCVLSTSNSATDKGMQYQVSFATQVSIQLAFIKLCTCIVFFLELCTDLAQIYEDNTCCATGRKVTKVRGWLQSLSYTELD